MAGLPQKTLNRIQRLRAKGIPLTEIAKRENVSYSAVYNHTVIKERYGSSGKYRNYLAKKNNSASDNPAKRRSYPSRFASYREYIEYLAKQNGFASAKDYRNYLAEQRKKRPENKIFGALVRKRLKEKGKNYSWLADQVGVTSTTASSYARGISIPRSERSRKVFSVLDLPYKTIDDLVA